jgi:glycerol-3-phosphate dehydrogenase
MKSRAVQLSNIADKSFDVCVIGGGATGAACALDAQLRGLRTVLLDAGDFAGATSSTATKIIHGGVRYLEEAIKDVDPKEYHVVVRALHERVRMLDNAPHLTRKLEFLVPSFHWLDVAYLDIGLKIYDWLAGSARISPSKFVSREETLKRMPQLNRDGLLGSVEYADGQFDDARYNLALVHTFAEAGGRGLNHCRVTDFHRDSRGRLSGLVAVDQLTGATLNLNARAMVNATGPVSDVIRQMATPSVSKRMRLSKGSHILFPLDLFPTDDAMLIPKTEAGSVLFAVPWGGRLLVGTTEREVAPGDDLYVTEEEVTYMLRQLNKYLTKPLQPSDIVSGFAGARPLVSASDGGATQKIARDDVIEIDAKSGLISIMGGKWTTHRAMAEDTINAVQKALGVAVSESLTRAHVLHGGEGFTSDLWEKLIRMYPVSKATAHHLAAKFGAAAWNVLELTRTNSSLAQPLIPGSTQIQAEVVYAVREELAAKIEDVVSRRIGLQYYSWRDAIKAAPVVGSLMAQELQWTRAQESEAVNRYVERIDFFLQGAGLEAEPNPPSRSSAA